jgi:hypothetical protein
MPINRAWLAGGAGPVAAGVQSEYAIVTLPSLWRKYLQEIMLEGVSRVFQTGRG